MITVLAPQPGYSFSSSFNSSCLVQLATPLYIYIYRRNETRYYAFFLVPFFVPLSLRDFQDERRKRPIKIVGPK